MGHESAKGAERAVGRKSPVDIELAELLESAVIRERPAEGDNVWER